MGKKNITKKERGKIALLSFFAVVSGAGITLSLIAFLGSEFNLGALIAFMISVGVCTWAIIEASKIQKSVDARTCGMQPEPIIDSQSGLYCKNCGAYIVSGVKFCSACGHRVSESSNSVATTDSTISGKNCTRCNSNNITYQTVTETRKSGCGTILLYVILALTVFGLLIVIPLMLRKKTETVTYAVCQNCGNRWRIK